MTDLVKCKALIEFVAFVPGYGMVVGAPDSTEDDARNPMVPASAVDTFVEAGRIEVGSKAKGGKPDPAPAADPATGAAP